MLRISLVAARRWRNHFKNLDGTGGKAMYAFNSAQYTVVLVVEAARYNPLYFNNKKKVSEQLIAHYSVDFIFTQQHTYVRLLVIGCDTRKLSKLSPVSEDWSVATRPGAGESKLTGGGGSP